MGRFLLLSLVTKNALKCTFQRPLNYKFYHGGPHPARRDSVWNRIWSFLSLHCMLLGYSFKPRPNILALDTADSVVNISLSIDRCLHTKTPFDEGIRDWLGQTFGLYPVRRGPSIFLDKLGRGRFLPLPLPDLSRKIEGLLLAGYSGCGYFKGLTRFRQSLFFCSSIKKNTKGDSARRVVGPQTLPKEWGDTASYTYPPMFGHLLIKSIYIYFNYNSSLLKINFLKNSNNVIYLKIVGSSHWLNLWCQHLCLCKHWYCGPFYWISTHSSCRWGSFCLGLSRSEVNIYS